MPKTINATLILALLLTPVCWSQMVDQRLQAKLSKTTDAYFLNAPDSLRALLKVASDFQLPMGIEWIKMTKDPVPVKRSWQAAAASAIVEDVVKASPGYEYEISNGVVHVFPTAMKGNLADVLNLRIGKFAVVNQYVNFASYELARRVKPIMVPPDLAHAPGGTGASILAGRGDHQVTFTIEDATVRDALDKLCLSADLNIWLIAYPAEETKTRGGFLKTIPMHTSVQREDDSFMPNWLFLQWGAWLVVND